jgi:hypothetical protein
MTPEVLTELQGTDVVVAAPTALGMFLASMLFGARRAEELLEKAAAHEQLHERGALRP